MPQEQVRVCATTGVQGSVDDACEGQARYLFLLDEQLVWHVFDDDEHSSTTRYILDRLRAHA